MQATKSTHTLNMRAVLITTLTADERAALYARYMAGEGATKLIAELGLDLAASQFMRIFPPEEIGGCCALCGGGLLRAKQSRHGQRQAAYCDACGHSDELGKRCGCASCSAALLKAYKERRAAKAATEAEKRSLAHKLYWSAEADAQSEPMTQWHTHTLLLIGAVSREDTKFAANLPDDLFHNCLANAIADRIVAPSPDLPASYFNNDGTADLEQLTYHDVVVGPACDFMDHDGHDGIASLLRQRLHDNPAAASTTWLDMVTNDCLRFVASRFWRTTLEQTRLPAGVPQLIRQHLTQRSMQEMTYVLYVAAEKCKAYLADRQCSGPQHATNGLLKRIRDGLSHLDERASSAVKFRRSHSSQSVLSRFFFEDVLGDGDDVGFGMSLTDWRSTMGFDQQGVALSLTCTQCGEGPVTLSMQTDVIELTCRACGAHARYHAAQ